MRRAILEGISFPGLRLGWREGQLGYIIAFCSDLPCPLGGGSSTVIVLKCREE
jgi:hypothetical protein